MQPEIINLYKPQGHTPLAALNKLRQKRPDLKESPLTYLGRLDPMASGVLLIMAGRHGAADRGRYLGLDKSYRAEVLFGFETDTGDVLGLAKRFRNKSISVPGLKMLLPRLKGKLVLAVPAYSSVPVSGRPLYAWAREGRLGKIKLPKRQMTIHSLKLRKVKSVGAGRLLQRIRSSVSRVEGDFRQVEIQNRWKVLLAGKPQRYFIAELEVSCSSGTYIRSLAALLGKRAGSKACLLVLSRLKVGEYKVRDSVKLD